MIAHTSFQVHKPVGIWIRVSTEDQAQGDSPEHHEKRARYYAESKEWEVKEVYHLEGVSGKTLMGHRETRRMLEDIRTGKIRGLIFSKLARLARNTKELLEFADIFREQHADLISLQESIDTSTPAGRLFYTMIAAMAQWEREEIADRVKASIAIRAKLGKPLSGRPAFGYTLKDKKIVPHPTEAPVRKLIYELFAEHRRYKTVAKILNESGYRTRGGGLFTHSTIERLIEDPTAKGVYRTAFTEKTNGRNWRTAKPESQWTTIPVEPIISAELWEQCHKLQEERYQPRKRPGKRPVHLFAGLAYCACGKKMYVPSNTPKYVCQACRIKIPIVDLENIFVEQLKGFFLSPDQLAMHVELADQNIKEKHKLLEVLQSEADKLQGEIDKVYQLYLEGQLSTEGFGKFYKPLEERQKQLGEELPKLQAELDLLRINGISADLVMTEAKDLYGRWKDLDKDEKRRVIESLTDRITIGKEEIDISLCFRPSYEEMTKRQRCLGQTRTRAGHIEGDVFWVVQSGGQNRE